MQRAAVAGSPQDPSGRALPISFNSSAAYSHPRSGILHHPALGPCRYDLAEVSADPDTQVAQVIGMMSRYAAADAADPLIRQIAYRAWHSDNPLDEIYRHVRSKMRFTRDEALAAPVEEQLSIPRWNPIVETLIRPRDLARLDDAGQGDCDDYSMYGASLLLASKIPCAFVTVAADDADPTIYSHVYLAAYPDRGSYAGSRVPMDCSHGPVLGWEAANRLHKRAEWPCGACSLLQLVGLGLLGWATYQLVRSS